MPKLLIASTFATSFGPTRAVRDTEAVNPKTACDPLTLVFFGSARS